MVLAGHCPIHWKSQSLSPLHQQHPSDDFIPSPVLTTRSLLKKYDSSTGNKIINNKYMILRELGRGVHGKVKLAQSLETNEPVAIKIVDKRIRKPHLNRAFLRPTQHSVSFIDQEHEQKIRREISILKKCIHPHVVKLVEVIEGPDSNKIYMALEYMDGGEIIWRDNQDRPVLDIQQARNIFRDVVSGLDYLHYKGVIHRDIKPANLLYSKNGVVKITDFSVSYFNKVLAAGNHMNTMAATQQVNRALAETAGTPAFFAPELCWAGDPERHDEGQHQITRAIDVWALGVTLYCFIFGRCPFTAATEYGLFEIIPTQPLTFPDNYSTSTTLDEHVYDVLERLLEKIPQDRISLDQVKTHPWAIQDLSEPEVWWHQANPRHYEAACITDEDVAHTYAITDRLQNSIHKLSNSFSHLTQDITRRRLKSNYQVPSIDEHQHFYNATNNPSSAIVHTNSIYTATSLLPLSPPPIATTMLCKSSDPPSTAFFSPTSTIATTTIYALGSNNSEFTSDETNDSIEISTNELDRNGDHNNNDNRRHIYQRNNSSTSSMSGLVVSFGKYRQ